MSEGYSKNIRQLIEFCDREYPEPVYKKSSWGTNIYYEASVSKTPKNSQHSLHSPTPDKPASIRITNGSMRECWYQYGIPSRPNDLPTQITTNHNGVVTMVWFINNCTHRLTGPATVELTNGKPTRVEYWISGKRLSFESFVRNYEMVYLQEYPGTEYDRDNIAMLRVSTAWGQPFKNDGKPEEDDGFAT